MLNISTLSTNSLMGGRRMRHFGYTVAMAGLFVMGTVPVQAQLLMEDGVEFEPQQNVHTFVAEAGQAVIIEMVSEEFDTFVTLLNPAGEILEQNDDYDGSPHATIVAQLPEAGEYTVLAGSFYGQLGGNYRVSVNPATDYQQVYDRALELMQSEDYGEASEAYQASILLEPNQPNAYLGRADALLRQQALLLGESFEGPDSLPDALRTEIVDNYEKAAQLFAANGQGNFAELILEQAEFIRSGQES
ncbi:MAG: hypothetical protein AAF959_21385 [Cyanobacteria bacterium P01_D01_bin.56]